MKKIYLSILISFLFSTQLFSQCTVTGVITSPTCVGLCNGRITATGHGGTAPYTYTWSTGATTRTITDLCAESYTVTVKDSKTCDVTHVFTVAAATPLTATVAVVNDRCFGEAAGAATVTAHGGTRPYTYSWNTTPVQTTRTARGLPGTYTVTVTSEGGCTTTATATITQPSQLVVTTSSTVSACGSATGSVSASASGGTAPYRYSWNTIPVTTTASITGLPSGQYIVTVTDTNGCTATETATVGNAEGLSATVTQTNVTCYGAANGSAIVTPVGGIAPYTYAWSTFPVQTGDTITGLPPGSYKVTVTDSSGCTYTAQITITQPARALAVTVSHADEKCFGSSDGTATAHPVGGTAPYSYSWSTNPVQTTREARGLAAGTYTVTVTDTNLCVATETVTITQPSTPVTVTMTSTNVTCYGAGDGTATAHVSGGTPGYTYRWGDNRTTPTITGLGIGTYHVTVTDRNGCTAKDSVTITRPAEIIIATNAVAADCGVANGAASAVVTSGGVSPFTYLWSPAGGTNSIATGLPAGVYKVTVTDSKGCSSSAPAVVPDTGAGTATITASNNVSCRGGDNGSAAVTMTGGVPPYKYAWTTTPVQTTTTATGLKAGTYGVVVTDSNGCIASATIKITQPGSIVTSLITQHTDDICYGGASGTATVNGAGGTPPYMYSWSPSAETTRTATDLAAGSYTVTVTDSLGCTSASEVRITQPPAITLSTTVSDITCNGESDGAASVDVTGGAGPFGYSWSTTPTQTTRTATGLAVGTYTVTVTEETGCQVTTTATIAPVNPIVLSTSSTNTTCGQTNGTATVSVVSGGNGTITYIWATNPVQTTATATGLSANTYSVTVVDSKGCSASATVTVGTTDAATATVHTDSATCFGQSNGSAWVTLTGGTPSFTYAWTTDPVQTTDTATALAAGTYGVIITDHSGCQTAAVVVVGQPDSIMAFNSVTNVTCYGELNGSASAVIAGGNGGFTYSWNSSPIQTTNPATGLAAGSYTLTITDSRGCTATDAVTISQPALPLIATASQLQTTCSNANTGIATATVTGGTPSYSYSWNSSPIQTTDTATGLAAASYTVTVTDSLGCVAIATTTISSATAITATLTPSNVTCFGYDNGSDSVSASGGNPSYSYSWNSSPVQNTVTASALPAGTYTVTVTDMNGCLANFSNTITQPDSAVTLALTTTNATCGNINGTATALVSGGTRPYTYLWSPSAQTTVTATNLNAGAYVVTATDANGCSNSGQATVGNAGAGRDSITSITDPNCYGGTNGSATVTVIGGTPPFRYSWNTSPVQTSATATNLAANTYFITVTDSNGCQSSINVFISQPNPIAPTITASNIICNGGGATGSASVSVTGGNPPYTYIWNPSAQTTDTASNLAVGTYTITITDSTGCSATAIDSIIQPPSIGALTSQTAALCNGSSDGTATVYPTGGTPPYNFLWSTNPVQDSSTAIGLSAGVYSVTISDACGSSATVIDTITQPAPIVLSTSSTKTTTCGTANGTATVTVLNGGIPSFSYSWSPTGATTPVDSNLTAGLYIVTVTDGNGCTNSDTAVVASTGAGTATITQVNDSCYGETNGSAFVTMTGGTRPFSYTWSILPIQTGDTAIGLAAGSYYVSVHDNAGCVTVDQFNITQPAAITYDTVIVNATCTTCANGSATINPSGGTGSYTYVWDIGQTTQTATGLLPGVYDFCITDANGCSLCDSLTVGEGLTGILNLTAQDTKLTVYPNPTSGQFTVEFQNESDNVSVRIISLIGQEIYSEIVNQTGKVTRTYNLNDAPKGMYLIQIISGPKVYIGRVIVE